MLPEAPLSLPLNMICTRTHVFSRLEQSTFGSILAPYVFIPLVKMSKETETKDGNRFLALGLFWISLFVVLPRCCAVAWPPAARRHFARRSVGRSELSA
jgi:hypothetical protein